MCEVHVANIWKQYWKIMKWIKDFLNCNFYVQNNAGNADKIYDIN